MPHHANESIKKWLNESQAVRVEDAILDDKIASNIIDSMRMDASGILFSGCVTFLDAIRGIQCGYFSWSTVKLYYSVFYAIRSILAGNLVAIFYQGRKAYSLELAAGKSPRRENGVTHEIVWKVFSRNFLNIYLNNEIDSICSYEWMKKLREESNYKNAKFLEPNLPTWFSYIDRYGLTNSISAYLEDDSMLYAFDKDHAILAYPIECLRRARLTLVSRGWDMEDDDQKYLNKCAELIELPSSIRSII